jgi:FkbM family methyltransferase
MNYSQNNEQQIILDYFGDFKGSLLDLGANDGITFSNSRALIERGWFADLVEPSPKIFTKLHRLYEGNKRVACFACAIGEENGAMILHESAHHLPDKSDYALLSSLKESETERWKQKGVGYEEIGVTVMNFQGFLDFASRVNHYDFISIDCEGMDLIILKQINLDCTKLICLEWNLNEVVKSEMISYCAIFGLNKILYTSGENIILAK